MMGWTVGKPKLSHGRVVNAAVKPGSSFLTIRRPSLQADGNGVCGPSAVAKAGCVRGNPHAVGDTGANNGDAGVASFVGSLFGWLGNRDRWPVCLAATELFWPVGRPCWSRSVGS